MKPTDSDPGQDASPPLRDGRYRLLDVLGEGGMAVVYRGLDTRLQVERAVKLLLPEMAARPRIRARFDAEARTMARLNHPHIVAIQDVDAEGDRVFLVMEMLRGGTLWGWVEQHGPMPARLAVDAMLPVLDALGFAHRAGVVHRDVKPQNVLLTQDGVPKLTDFGIARIEAEGSRTRTAAVMGTWTYMPPEQRKSAKDTDARADIYAVGAMIYALVLAQEPPDLFAAGLDPTLLVGLPAPLSDVVRTATHYRREDRYSDAMAMGQALLVCRGALPAVPPELAALGPVHVGTGVALTRGLTNGRSGASTPPPLAADEAGPRVAPTAPAAHTLPPAGLAGPGRTATAEASDTFPAVSQLSVGVGEQAGTAVPAAPAPSFLAPAAAHASRSDPGTMVPPTDGTLSTEAADAALSAAPPADRARRPWLGLGVLAFALVAVAVAGSVLLRGGDEPVADPDQTEVVETDGIGSVPPAEATTSGTAGTEPGEGPAPTAAELPPQSDSPPPATATGTAGGDPRPAQPAVTPAATPAAAAPAPAPAAPLAAPTPAAGSGGVPAEDPAAEALPEPPSAEQPAAEQPLPEEPRAEPPPPEEPAAGSAATSAGPPGRVSVTGQVTDVRLVDQASGRSYSTGEVPAGNYWLELRFLGDSETARVTSVRVISAYALTVKCHAPTRTCR